MNINRNLLITIGAVIGAALITTLVYRMVNQRARDRQELPRRGHYALEEMQDPTARQLAAEVTIMEDARNRQFDDFPKFDEPPK